jgi:hypothetical protein
MGLQLFGDSQGKVWIYEQATLHSSVNVLVPPPGSEWHSDAPDSMEQFGAECGSKELVALAPFGRGFVAITKGGFLAVCGMQRSGCGSPAALCCSLAVCCGSCSQRHWHTNHAKEWVLLVAAMTLCFVGRVGDRVFATDQLLRVPTCDDDCHLVALAAAADTAAVVNSRNEVYHVCPANVESSNKIDQLVGILPTDLEVRVLTCMRNVFDVQTVPALVNSA